MTINIWGAIFITAVLLIILLAWSLYEFFKKLKRAEGEYDRLDKAIVLHKKRRQPLTFLEKQWIKKGYKWYRIIIKNENGLIFKEISLNESRIETKSGERTFTLKKLGTYIIQDECVTFDYADIPYLTYFKDYPLPVKTEIPQRPPDKEIKKNPKLSIQFMKPTLLTDIITDSTAGQLVYEPDIEGFKQYLMIITILVGVSVFLSILTLVFSLMG